MKYEFRWLTLHETDIDNEAGDSIIRASLHRVSLINPPRYQALSYCWGDPSITKPILLNSTYTVHVTTNLEVALRELKGQGFKTLWIDALCLYACSLSQSTYPCFKSKMKLFSTISILPIYLGPISLYCDCSPCSKVYNVLMPTCRP